MDYEVDRAINMYSGIYHNPFLIWGRYRQEGSRFLLQISFQFHHVQMDGLEACAFLDGLQRQIDHLGKLSCGMHFMNLIDKALCSAGRFVHQSGNEGIIL